MSGLSESEESYGFAVLIMVAGLKLCSDPIVCSIVVCIFWWCTTE